jgi:hypothetical protein
MDPEIKEFFMRYERANSSSDALGMGELYAETFMFGGPKGVQPVKKDDFLKVIPRMKAHYASMGLAETQLQTVEGTLLSSKYLLAKTAWRMTIQSSSGARYVDAFATYVLMRGPGDTLSIVFQIDHQDLASVLKEQQSSK